MIFVAESRFAALAVLGLLVACSRREPPGSSPPASTPAPIVASASASAPAAGPAPADPLPAEELSWTWTGTPIGEMRAVVLVPARAPGQRFPVLVTMHGRGEALKGPERGARGWVDDYALGRAIRRLAAPPLTRDDFEGHVTRERLAHLNEALQVTPYRGLIVVCPYTPDMLAGDRPFEKAPRLAEFLVEVLLPKVHAETPAIGTPASTGLDGVSLGGRAALTSGLLRPEAFGAVGTLQAAFDVKDAPEIAARARSAREKNPGQRLRLLSSEGDYYLRANRAIDAALAMGGVKHDFLVVAGPHDYDFNRGPGALEMLLFHDRALRGEPTP
jgi:iron(III)-salmochelin esterase